MHLYVHIQWIRTYSVDDVQSYELIDSYLLKIQLIKPHAPVVLVSTKCDLLSEKWKVSDTMGRYLSARYGLPLIETSAKTEVGIVDTFALVITKLRYLKEITSQMEHETNRHCCSIC